MAKSTTKSPARSRPSMPQISEAEWVVMNVVVEKAPVTANQVVAALADLTPWKTKTIQTLLRRLVGKGALVFDKQGREHVFRPSVDCRKLRLAEGQSFLQRLFGGRMAPFLACFLEHEKLSSEDIKELRSLLKMKGS